MSMIAYMYVLRTNAYAEQQDPLEWELWMTVSYPGGCWEPNPHPPQEQRYSELLSHGSVSKTASFYVAQADLKLSVSCLCLQSAAID